MFGGAFGGTTGFGQPAAQPAFGAQPAQPAASPFGGAFGAPAQPAASPFGAPAPAAGAPLFGAQSPAPAFGAAAPAAAPAFGAQTTTGGFGAAGFGAAAKPAGFGGFGATAAPANPFGATTQTPGAFGATAQSAPAFGAGLGTAPSFGTTLNPTPGGFGATSTPAFGAPQSAAAFGGFGASSAPAFGAPAAAAANPFGAPAAGGFGASAPAAFGAAPAATGFGAPAATPAAPFGSTTSNLFGAPAAAPSPFGAPAGAPAAGGFGGFGAAAPGAPTTGTRNVPYSKTKDPDAPAGQVTFLMSISALSNYNPPSAAKSHEELRWEDYEAGVKNQSAGPAPAAAGAFGAPAPGTTTGFGGFGATATQPAAGGFGAPAANPFGAPASSAPAFGASSAPAFGATSTPSLFGSTPAAATPANPFGAPAATASAFGGFGAAPASQPSLFGANTATTNAFGATAGAFGAATPFGGAASQPASSFNFATSSPSTFGAASAPASGGLFGAPASAASPSPFGATGAFGAVGSPFGGASSASALGTSTFGAFGATAAKPASPFGAPAATTTPFGTTAPATGGGLFGGSTPFNFNTAPAATPSLFGASTAAGGTMSFTSNLFGGNTLGQTAAPTGGLFGGAAAAAPAAQAQPPTVAQPAYGAFSSLPAVPDAKVGITTRGARNGSISNGASKASPLLSLRATPVRYGASVRARSEQPLNLGGAAAAAGGGGLVGVLGASARVGVGVMGGMAGASSDLLTPQAPGSAGAAAAAAAGGSGLLPLRQNPHRLFIAAPPPSTEAAGGSSFLSPARPASSHRGGGATPPDGYHDPHLHGHGHGHDDDRYAETPAGARTGGSGHNGYTNGYATGGAGAGGASGPAFHDAPPSEAHLPRLGRLVSEGYTFSPNVDELRLLHSQNPANLAAVSNFTVSRAGVGQVRWVVPVDVRGLALADIVAISYGEVACYPDPATKPPQGQGLNKPAELTLYGVYRKDKETGALIKDGPRAQAYEKALRQMCGRMGAKFVSYKLDGGVWKFEVEHFSRYGLLDEDDDYVDDGMGVQGEVAPAAAPLARPPRVGEEGVGEAPGARPPRGGRLGLMGADGEEGAGNVPLGAAASPAAGLVGRGLAGVGLGGFAFGGGPAASAAGRAAGALAVAAMPEDSGMEPSVGPRRLLGAEGGLASEATSGAADDQDMSEARAQLRFGDDPTAEAEVSGGVVGPPAAGGSVITGSIALGGGGGGFGGGAADAAMAEPAPAAVPLQHALPASLAHDPVRVRALHDAFFGGGGGGGGGAAAVAGDGWTHQQQQQPHHHHHQHHRQALQAAGSMISGALPMGGAGEAARAGAATAAAAAAALREGGGATSAAPSGPMATTWRRPAAALSAGAPAAVMARGAALLSEVGGGDSGGGAGAAGAGSPISLALARAVTVRPSPSAPEGAAGAVLPLKEVATARYLTDAGLAMGRSFRVGWGPGGKLVVPGAAEATTATEICVTRVRVEGEGAAYREVSGSGAADAEEAEGLEALRERLRAALEVHLAASKPRESLPAAGGDVAVTDASGDVAVTDAADDGAAAAVAAAAAAVPPHWRLCVDNRELAVLVERYVRVCEQQLHSMLGGGSGAADGGSSAGGAAAAAAVDADHPDAARLRHEIDTWRLVEVLFARIDGEVPEEAAGGSGGAADFVSLSTPPATPGNALALVHSGDHDMAAAAAGSTAGDGPAAPRTLLAALQRRAALGLWLQRQARRRVEEDLAALPHGSSPAAVALHLLAAHQLAAAAGAAVAAGDTRLALLISRAGGRSSAKQQLAAQLTLWRQQGFSEHIAPERLAAYHLMAGQVLETQRLLSLDWRRLLGLQLWYAAAPTSSPLTALQRYLMDRHTEPGVVPHPAPYHVEGLQPSATGAGSSTGSGGATDVQWELLQLWSTTPAAATADCLSDGRLATAPGVASAAERAREGWLAGGGCSRLLRCAGYSPNPLDHSLAWHLMTSLQACQVLPKPGAAAGRHGADAHAGSPPPAYESELLGTTLEFISQLLLAGGLCEWALYVALTIPDLPAEEGGAGGGAGEDGEEEGAGRSPAVRTRIVRELLAMTAPEWMGDSTREAFLTNTLRIPAPLLAEARATWAHYARDDAGRCAALLAAGSVAAAHNVFSSSVAPGLFLAGAWEQLAALVAALEPAAAALPAWSAGGGLYGNFLALFGRQLTAAAAAAAAPPGVGMQELLGFAAQVQEAQLGLDPRVGGGPAAAAGGSAAGGAAGAAPVVGADEGAERSRLRRRLVLGRMASRVHGALMSCSVGGPGGAAAGWEERSVGLQAGLALQGCLAAELQLGGVAVAVAEAGARVAACSS